MNIIPDLNEHGYKIQKVLNNNVHGGRITYQALDLNNNKLVVIKKFQFISPGNNWSDYESITKEIEILSNLNHPYIPQYLNSFDTENGFCLVQEYKEAQTLSSVINNLSLRDIKNIAVAILEILVYLQEQNPFIIHRDIKPENILFTKDLQIYLVDFGFARINSLEIAASSTVKGTIGFMPPEQIFNQPLTKASDLYSLGVTLVCLLTKTKSTEIGLLVDKQFKLNFKHLLPAVQPEFYQWLEKMVQSEANKRFKNAKQALQALRPLSVINYKPIKLTKYRLSLVGEKLNRPISANLILDGQILNQVEEAEWKVAANPNDLSDNSLEHPWISFTPQVFSPQINQKIQCTINVDTTLLQASRVYYRNILLQSTSDYQSYLIPLKVKTAPIPNNLDNFPYLKWFLCFVAILVISLLAIANLDFLGTKIQEFWGLVISARQLSHYLLINDWAVSFSLLIGIGLGISFYLGYSESDPSDNLQQMSFLTYLIFLTIFTIIISIFYGLIISGILAIVMYLYHLIIQENLIVELVKKQLLLSGSLTADSLSLGIFTGFILAELFKFYDNLVKAGLNKRLAVMFILNNFVLGVLVAIRFLGYELNIIATTIYLLLLALLLFTFTYLIVKENRYHRSYRENEKMNNLIES